jgi:hypothetical protein
MSRTYLKEMNWQYFFRAGCRPWPFCRFFAKGSASDPVGNHCPVANRHVFAPRHGPLVWHASLESCPVKPINKSEILKAETLTC